MDTVDSKLVALLLENGRRSWAELAEHVGLSAPAVADRVHRLEEHGVIRGYAALADRRALGLTVTAYVFASVERARERRPFLELIAETPEVVECHHVAGDSDFLMKVHCRDTAHLDELLSERLKGLDGVVRTRTTVVLGTFKDTPQLPLENSTARP